MHCSRTDGTVNLECHCELWGTFHLFLGWNLKFLSLIYMQMLTNTLPCFTANDLTTSMSVNQWQKHKSGNKTVRQIFMRCFLWVSPDIKLYVETAVSNIGLRSKVMNPNAHNKWIIYIITRDPVEWSLNEDWSECNGWDTYRSPG